MTIIRACPLPDDALLQEYRRNGSYTDCFATDLPTAITHEQYVTAFYTTWLFRLERVILKWIIARPSTDAQARQLAAGTLDQFAAWDVEKRADNQVLLCDLRGRTRSWLMTDRRDTGGTRLYFGSAVVPGVTRRRGFGLLLGFHTLYSRALLYLARIRLGV